MSSGLKYILIFALAILTTLPLRLFAKESAAVANEKPGLKYNLKLDLAAITISSVGSIIIEASGSSALASTCRWCSVNAFDKWGRENLKWSGTSAANTAGTITAYGLAPLAAFGGDALAANHDGRMRNFKADAIVIAEATAVSSLIAQVVKISVGRQRPDAHFGGAGFSNSDGNASFYSGHTNVAFALAVSSGTVATMRGYKLAPVVWGTGLAIAITTAYLRIASDKHYLTDVISGAAIGSAFGFGLPYLFHRPKEKKDSQTALSAVPVDGGILLGVSRAF